MSDSRRGTPRVSTSSQRPMARSWPLPAPPSGRSPKSCDTPARLAARNAAAHALPNARVTHHYPKAPASLPAPRALEPFVLQNLCSPRYPRHSDANNQLRRWAKGENKGSDRQQPTRRVDGRETGALRPASTPLSERHMPDQCRERPRRLKLQRRMYVFHQSLTNQPCPHAACSHSPHPQPAEPPFQPGSSIVNALDRREWFVVPRGRCDAEGVQRARQVWYGKGCKAVLGNDRQASFLSLPNWEPIAGVFVCAWLAMAGFQHKCQIRPGDPWYGIREWVSGLLVGKVQIAMGPIGVVGKNISFWPWALPATGVYDW